VPKSLPALPLGYHYPQTSTDRTYGRAQQGFWAKDRGKIYIVPWLQSTETVLIKWDGIKRTWADADLIDDDPLLQQAVFEYMRWKHADRWDKDEAEAARAQAAYVGAPGTIGAREMLIHQCREETRARACEGSNARSSPLSITNLFYNDEQSASATCPDGTSGSSVSVTIPAGTVASGVSVADANQKAKAQAQRASDVPTRLRGSGSDLHQRRADRYRILPRQRFSAAARRPAGYGYYPGRYRRIHCVQSRCQRSGFGPR
jgi:hypothetical protein